MIYYISNNNFKQTLLKKVFAFSQSLHLWLCMSNWDIIYYTEASDKFMPHYITDAPMMFWVTQEILLFLQTSWHRRRGYRSG